MKQERILLLQLKRIGDCILTAPAAAALRAAHPAAEIVMVAPPSVADLAGCFTGVDRVLAYRPWSLNADVWASVLIGEWDACYDFTGTDRSALMTRLSGAKKRVGYAKFANGLRARAYTELCEASVRDLHTVDFHLALTQQGALGMDHGASGDARAAYLSVPASSPALPAPSYVVHIGTAREEKFWPVERWAEVIEQLPAGSVLLTGTNAGLERPHLDLLRAMLRRPVMDLTGQLSLVDLAGLIQRCDLAIGVDSMAMHLAAMFGRPQVVLFGPTNPFHWRPRQPKAVVLAAGHDGPVAEFDPRAKGAPMELISTGMVLSAIHRALSNH
jgi:ADP-heptose:LPS heptosyltransferase